MQRVLERAGPKHLRSKHDVCVHRGGVARRLEGAWDRKPRVRRRAS